MDGPATTGRGVAVSAPSGTDLPDLSAPTEWSVKARSTAIRDDWDPRPGDVGTPVWVVDRDGRTMYANQTMCDLLACSAATLWGGGSEQFVARRGENDLTAAGVYPWVFARTDGVRVSATVQTSPVPDRDGGVAYTVLVVLSGVGTSEPPLDDTRTDEARSRQREAGDSSVYSSTHFEGELTAALISPHVDTVSIGVMRADVDGFRVIRDRYGERTAGELLRAVVERICVSLPLGTTIGQVDIDEFGVMIEDCGPGDLAALAARVLCEVARPLHIGGIELMPTISIGLTQAELDSTAATLLAEATQALDRARHHGGDRFEIYDERMRSRARERAEFAAELRHAIAQRQLSVAYQPVVRVDGAIVGLEALLRWNHPTRGSIPASQVIEIAEETGLIHDVGRLVLTQACAELARWRLIRPDLRVSVNLSGRQLVRANIVAEIERSLAAEQLPAEALCLEITETVLMDDPAAAVAALTQLRRKGIRIAIDDFGTGYSSLLYLRRFPLQVLKLDRLFVAGIESDSQSRDIVDFVLKLAHSLNMVTVAEGVETSAQLDVLRELGCDLIQGYYWSKPLPANEITSLLLGGKVLEGAEWTELPAAEATDPVEVVDTGDQLAANADPAGRHRVLLVDDSAGQRNLTRITLEDTGRYAVVAEADCAEDALVQAKQYRPDLIVLDLAMPGRNGLDVIAELLAASPSTEVAVCSGFVSSGLAASARAEGASACLDKSLPPDRLIEQLDALL